MAEFLRQLITLIVGIGILAYVTPKLSLIMLLTFPVIVLSAIFFGRYIRNLSKSRQEKIAHANALAEESLQSFNIVKAYTSEKYEVSRYIQKMNDVVGTSLSFAKIKGLFFVFIITVLFGAIFFILWQGAMMVSNKEMAIGDLFSFIIYTGIIGGAIASLGTFYTSLVGALGATDRILDIMSTPGEMKLNDNDTDNCPSLDQPIHFDHIEFSYTGRKEVNVLQDINLTIKPGEKIALVGSSGAGKSTIVSLLLRFNHPNKGKITIGDTNIEDIDLTAYRSNFAIVPQDVILFSGSIRENIAYGKKGATDEEVINAATQANALEFIESFPDGLDTIVGDRGIRLSGGQKQRVAIARAILRDPKILILDEATSSLDASSERIVQSALDRLMEGRTAIIIAHRLATIKSVDTIYVLNKGKIIEKGSHLDLIDDPNSYYRHMASLQQLTQSDIL